MILAYRKKKKKGKNVPARIIADHSEGNRHRKRKKNIPPPSFPPSRRKENILAITIVISLRNTVSSDRIGHQSQLSSEHRGGGGEERKLIEIPLDGARYAARSLKEKHGDSSPFSHSGVNNSSHAEDVIRDGGWPADEVYEILDAVSVTSSNWRGRR